MTPNQALRKINKRLEVDLVEAVDFAKKSINYRLEEKERANNAEERIIWLEAIITKLTEK
jgi:hypothetical protein